MPALTSDQFISGAIAATSQVVTLSTNGYSTVGIAVSGTFSGSLTVRASVDYSYAANPTWVTTTAVPVSTGLPLTAITGTGLYQVNAAGFSAIQVFGTSIVSGTANIALLGSAGVSTVMADNPIPTTPTSQYPNGSTPITASSGNVAAATATATLAAATAKTTYIAGLAITSSGSTAAAVVSPTITGVITGTMTLTYATVAGATLSNQPLVIPFNPPIPANAVNTAIAVALPSLGTGNTNATVVAWGYQL